MLNKMFVAAMALLMAVSMARADDFGVLVMAHGGDATWNREVEGMLSPLARDYPLEVAFGMADAKSLQDGVSKLEARGVRRIGVVRLFISGESWYERTEQILGLRSGAPQRPQQEGGADQHGPGQHGAHMAFWRINTNAAFAVSTEGLSDAPEMGAVLVERARALSRDPRSESVLVIAHGAEADDENQRWLTKIDAQADSVRQALPFRRVQVETLREDWPEKRKVAEGRIHAFVQDAGQAGGRAIVIPYRIQGFGPYAKVLDGFSYVSDGKGLIPSVEIEHWVRRQAQELRAGSFHKPQADADEHAGH
jgi:sirohydrochlorin cobaltochelatase